MASLVAPLACGIIGAESGSVEFYRQGTATTATVYSDAEGVTAVTSHALDANGGIARYVEERVDVTVLDSDGATVRTFTWGTDARDARVENLGFTGTNALGATVAGGRTTVDAVLTKALASFGTTDFNILINGSARTVADAVASSAGLVFNVKNSPYEATGDGTTDDSAAIQAAINAAVNAGGGIVYFPSGTYLINSALSVPTGTGKLTYLGESATGSKIKQGTSGITMLDLGQSNNNLLLGLTFTATSSNTGVLVQVNTGGRATFLGCAFDAVNGAHVKLVTTAIATLLSCSMSQAGASSRLALGTTSASFVSFSGCDISTAGSGLTSISLMSAVRIIGSTIVLGSTGGAAGSQMFISGSRLNIVGSTITCSYASGSPTLCDGGGNLVISGCTVADSTGNGLTLLGSGGLSGVFEAANYFGDTVTLGTVYAPSGSYSATRDHRTTKTSGSATTYTPSGEYMLHEVTSTGASMAFANPSPSVPVGTGLTIIYKNTSGGTITPTFGTDYSATTAFGSVDNGKSGVYLFLPHGPGSGITGDLVCISPQAAGGYTL